MIGPAPKPTPDFIAGFEAAAKIAQRLIEVPGLTLAQQVAVGGVALRLAVDLEALRALAAKGALRP